MEGNGHLENLKKMKENMYEFKTEKRVVQMVYPEKGKKFNDCMLHLLKQKYHQMNG